MPPIDLKTDTDNPGIYLAGGIALACGAYFLYASVHGLIQYRAGSDLASDDPLICAFGLLAGCWMILMGTRIFLRVKAPDSQLLTSPELLVASLASIGASPWFLSIGLDPLRCLGFLAIGVFGLLLWNHRRRKASRAPSPR